MLANAPRGGLFPDQTASRRRFRFARFAGFAALALRCSRPSSTVGPQPMPADTSHFSGVYIPTLDVAM
jgi:hypothetical protein